MNDEKNEKKDIIKDQRREQEQEDILEEYLKPKRLQIKFWRWVILAIVFVILVIVYKTWVIDPTLPPEELVASMEIFNIESQWIKSEELDTPDFKGIVLVPQISFQVRNIGKAELYYVYFLGVFRLLDRPKALGEGTFVAFKKPLKPGEESERITLNSKFGYRGSSKQAFKKYYKEWRSAMVQIYVSSGTSRLSFLKSFYISRRIEGLDVDITVTDKQYKDIVIEEEKDQKK
ncbi:MAG: hypothetical protein GTO45_08065 [Candidatus Aminicenantes bacterium]|nr:hypothetical protein [Candidatus Aminicenantes bacterium]NIM78786.1 hypothetical protein [Candidatus Aminicenantes bacterium]NIN18041.1 hypothetical protein [Candidatus Aminicenantes bacterium]NIN41941.1 hypothetical protein [Candidatus Aminicenantes bacterium]NIN84696.1 hypothetical protein [Candidatus Aminicenantes bacterium]